METRSQKSTEFLESIHSTLNRCRVWPRAALVANQLWGNHGDEQQLAHDVFHHTHPRTRVALASKHASPFWGGGLLLLLSARRRRERSERECLFRRRSRNTTAARAVLGGDARRSHRRARRATRGRDGRLGRRRARHVSNPRVFAGRSFFGKRPTQPSDTAHLLEKRCAGRTNLEFRLFFSSNF